MQTGFDFHGVLDKYKVFRKLTNLLVTAGHGVHIITGEENTPGFREKLDDLCISRTNIFSITSYHKKKGTSIRYDKNGEPWIDRDLWNKTKADYCRRNKINLHIDDSAVYGEYFTTPFLLLCKGKKK
jgi:hypothetical protein